MNITYLFGAGASYYSCPILYEQGDKMIQLSDVMGYSFKNYEDIWGGIEQLDYVQRMLWDLYDYGRKANEFNTVDTYAKKLYLMGEIDELIRLKSSVSLFFTLWLLTDNKEWKRLGRYKGNEGDKIESIDHRYINLLATYLEEGKKKPCLRSNVKFITWNYDLQIESAYSKFTDLKENNFILINKYFPFIPKIGEEKDLKVCHLNGFHGFYGEDESHNLFGRTDSRELNELLTEFSFLKDLAFRKYSFMGYINYAWEKESLFADIARKQALKILANTDILIIVGYSFPPFNNVIDKELFEIVSRRVERIIYQDPMANKDVLIENFGLNKNKIVIVDGKMDQFVIPNYHKSKSIHISELGSFIY